MCCPVLPFVFAVGAAILQQAPLPADRPSETSGSITDGTALIELVPVGTVDCYGEATIEGNEITIPYLSCGVELEIRISGWDQDQDGTPTLAAYQAQLDCAGFSSGLRGTLVASEYESYIDDTREDYTLAGLSNETNLDTSLLCPDGLPGPFIFSANTLGGAAATDPGTDTYAGTFVVYPYWDEKGTFTLNFDPNPDATFLTDGTGQPITPVSLSPALITIGTGRCCLLNVAPGEHIDVCHEVTDRECWDLGMELGKDSYFDSGLDCLDPPCPCGVPCISDEACYDADMCTDEFCDFEVECGCAYPPNYDVGTQCCDPSTGNTVSLPDGDPCTDDVCDTWSGQVTHEPIHGRACVEDSDCAPGACVDLACVCTSDEGCCLPDGTCQAISAELCEEQDGFVVAACAGDLDGDGRDDTCTSIPTLPQWGVIILALALLVGGTIVARRRHPEMS